MRAALLAVLLLAPGASLAEGEWTLLAPAEVVADGRARVQVELRTANDAPDPAELEVSVNAGTIEEPLRQAGPGAYVFTWRVPRLAAPGEAQLTVTSAERPRAGATVKLAGEPVRLSRLRPEGPAGFDLPDRIILSTEGTSLLRLTRWTSGAPPRVQVSAGDVGLPRRAGDGAWEVDYRLPKERYPRVLLVAVLGPAGELVDWSFVPLVGAGLIETETDPNAWVRVRLDGEEYGPVRTDAGGRARLGILAPPGLRSAETLAADALGNVIRRRLELGIPPGPSALALCPEDGEELTVLAVGPDGLPLSGVRVELKGTGLVSAVAAERSSGVWVGPLQRVDPRSPKELAVTASAGGRRLAGCQWRPPPPLPARLELTAASLGYRAGTGGEVLLHLAADDAQGPLATALEVRADFGELGPLQQKAPGRYSAVLKLPDFFEGRRQVRLEAGVRGRPPMAALTVPLEPGPLAALQLSAAKARLDADGESDTTVRASSTDAHGNPVRPQKLEVRAEGAVAPFAWGDGATARAAYVPPERFEPLVDTVVVSVPGTEVGSELRLPLEASAPRLSVGARLGAAGALGRPSPLGMVDAQYRPTFFRRRVAFGVEAGYLTSAEDRPDRAGLAQVHTRVWLAPTLARVSWAPLLAPVRLYGGVGLGALWFGWASRAEATGTRGRSGVALAAAPHLGVERRVGPGSVSVEASWLLARPPDPAFGAGLAGPTLTGGYRLER